MSATSGVVFEYGAVALAAYGFGILTALAGIWIARRLEEGSYGETMVRRRVRGDHERREKATRQGADPRGIGTGRPVLDPATEEHGNRLARPADPVTGDDLELNWSTGWWKL